VAVRAGVRWVYWVGQPRLTRPNDKANAVHAKGREVLVFEMGGRRFGLPVLGVKELLRAVTAVPLPAAPAVVEGVINYRGVVVPVLDLRGRLGLPARPVEPADLLIIAEPGDGGGLLALRVDKAFGIVTAEPVGVEGGGVVRLADGLAPVLEPRGLLTGPEAKSLRHALSGAGPAAGREPPP